MDLPIDIIETILNYSSISAMLAWAIACVKIPQNVKRMLITNKKLSWISHTIIDKNGAMLQYLIDNNWQSSTEDICYAVRWGTYFAFNILQFIKVERSNIIKILGCALNSGNISTVRCVIGCYEIIYVEYDEAKLLFNDLGDHCNIINDESIKFLWDEYSITARRAAKKGYLNIFKRLCPSNADLTAVIISAAIRGGNIDIINYISELGHFYDQRDIETAVYKGNIATLEYLILNGGVIDDYVNLQNIAANKDNFPMFKFVYKLKKEKTAYIFQTVFQRTNIEIMQYLHKHNWPLHNITKLSFTGIRYMHSHMRVILPPRLYVTAMKYNDSDLVNYLIYNNIYLTKVIFNEIAKEFAPYATWKLILRARKISKNLGIWK